MHELKSSDNFIGKLKQTVRERWDKPALRDYGSEALTYGDFAREIETQLLLWKAAGLQPGDKVALNARSSARWATVFMSAQVGGYVAVQIFPGFTHTDTENMIIHSESRLVYTEKGIFEQLDRSRLPRVLAFVDCKSGELLAGTAAFTALWQNRLGLFEKAWPQGLRPEDVAWEAGGLDRLAAIMYTSGSTGKPKGVRLLNRNLTANVYIVVPRALPYYAGENYVSVLPYTHIFGMMYDMIVPLCYGMQLVVLGLPPVPTYLKPALRQFKPRVFFSVPLILTKLLEDAVGEFIYSRSGAEKLARYADHPDFCEAISTIFMKALGGNVELFATGGAAIPEPFERLFVEQLGLPFITGYGMTETAPMIAVGQKDTYKLRECGEYAHEILDLRIDSPDPAHIPGEILVRGHVLFDGYYKNPEATQEAMTADGWFRTGDMATLDAQGSLFIVGRCKNMILTPNGQNIYPEEIEVVLNAFEDVAESLVVSRNDRLTALIVPNADRLEHMDAGSMQTLMKAHVEAANKRLPAYCQISSFELVFEPFAKTPKGSIKRFMYA